MTVSAIFRSVELNMYLTLTVEIASNPARHYSKMGHKSKQRYRVSR